MLTSIIVLKNTIATGITFAIYIVQKNVDIVIIVMMFALIMLMVLVSD